MQQIDYHLPKTQTTSHKTGAPNDPSQSPFLCTAVATRTKQGYLVALTTGRYLVEKQANFSHSTVSRFYTLRVYTKRVNCALTKENKDLQRKC